MLIAMSKAIMRVGYSIPIDKNFNIDVLDTEDGVIESYTMSEILNFPKSITVSGIRIDGKTISYIARGFTDCLKDRILLRAKGYIELSNSEIYRVYNFGEEVLKFITERHKFIITDKNNKEIYSIQTRESYFKLRVVSANIMYLEKRGYGYRIVFQIVIKMHGEGALLKFDVCCLFDETEFIGIEDIYLPTSDYLVRERFDSSYVATGSLAAMLDVADPLNENFYFGTVVRNLVKR